MSASEDFSRNNCEGDLPSNEEIINEVVESCQKLNVHNNENGVKQDDNEMAEKTNTEDQDEDFVDEIHLKDQDVSCSPQILQDRKQFAMEMKESGNTHFKNGEYHLARKKYTEALRICPLKYSEERAVLYANRGAAKLKEGEKKGAIEDCSKAIELNSDYVKAYIRRAKLYEETDKLDEALEDYKKILELDPGCSEARIATMRLPSQINERNEKLKAEMLGSLKELGNKLLKPFGLSTDNFQVQQDPNSGGYSINFTQNKK